MNNPNPMHLSKYRITIIPTTNLTLPPYKPPTFRGGFGHALRRVMCVNRGETCTKCPLKTACAYTYIFETAPQQAMNRKSEDTHLLHPFMIEPPMSEKRHYSRDDRFDLQLIHIGRAINYAPYFIFAFEGLGRLSMERSRVADVMNIGCEKETIIYDGDSHIRDNQQMIDSTGMIHEVSQLNHHRIAFRFLTPIRIGYKTGS